MPYIKVENRGSLYSFPELAPTPGNLNFMVTKSVDQYLRERGLSYATINECIGVLECAKLELYRRIAAPYEDGKMAENGDVYTVKP